MATGLCAILAFHWMALVAGGDANFLNPDIAMGKRFFVAAKQFDGTQRCYFIKVGSRIEQGAVMHAKGANAECKASYKKEIALGSYDGTIDRDTKYKQIYKKGDSTYCGSRKDADQRGLVRGKEKRVGRKIKRRTILTMIKKEDQAGITAVVREPHKCVYEVVLYGPEILLLGGGGSSGGRIGGSGRRSGLSTDERSQKKNKNKNKKTRRRRRRRGGGGGGKHKKSQKSGSSRKRKRHHEGL